MSNTLFSEQTTDATSSSHQLTEFRGVVAVSGTWDGASVALELSVDDSEFISSDTVTSDSMRAFQFMKGGYIRAVITSAGASTSLTVEVREER